MGGVIHCRAKLEVVPAKYHQALLMAHEWKEGGDPKEGGVWTVVQANLAKSVWFQDLATGEDPG